jgi:hypothetical protein
MPENKACIGSSSKDGVCEDTKTNKRFFLFMNSELLFSDKISSFKKGKCSSRVTDANFDTDPNAAERLSRGEGRTQDEYIARAAGYITAFDGKFYEQK